jgi:hypothetical protein
MQANQVQEVVSRVISDPSFAEALATDAEGTLRGAGIEPTPEVLEALKGLDKNAIQRLATAFSSPTGAA